MTGRCRENASMHTVLAGRTAMSALSNKAAISSAVSWRCKVIPDVPANSCATVTDTPQTTSMAACGKAFLTVRVILSVRLNASEPPIATTILDGNACVCPRFPSGSLRNGSLRNAHSIPPLNAASTSRSNCSLRNGEGVMRMSQTIGRSCISSMHTNLHPFSFTLF